MGYCAYLRKSRADDVREKIEPGYDALAHHRNTLEELSSRMGSPIERWYSDGIKSGEKLEHREGMGELLSDVRSGAWEGVLCMEVERLTRGDLIDQGTVIRAFADSGTLIVTPNKVYDPASEADMEYFEFGLFMSRREFKTINKRLIAGRVASVKEGQYIGQRTPYGYDKARVGGMKTLVPNGNAKWVVRMFEMFADGMSYKEIAKSLDAMGAPTYEGRKWNPSCLRKMLTNPVYIGKVRWNSEKEEIYYEGSHRRTRKIKNPDEIVVDGLHEGIVSDDLWCRAMERVEAAPVRGAYKCRNHYGRILVCAECGRPLRWQASSHPNGEPVLKHKRDLNDCQVKGCRVSVMDKAVIDALEAIAVNLDLMVGDAPEGDLVGAAADCMKEAERSRKAIQDNFDRMERGIISEEDFVDRRAVLEERIAASIAEAERLESLSKDAVREKAVTVRDCIRAIGDDSLDAEDRRRIVWSLIDRIEYRNHGTVGNDEIELEIFMR